MLFWATYQHETLVKDVSHSSVRRWAQFISRNYSMSMAGKESKEKSEV